MEGDPDLHQFVTRGQPPLLDPLTIHGLTTAAIHDLDTQVC
jgi:hypothetical protein